MKRYFFNVLAGVGLVGLFHYLTLFNVRAPLVAEYWLREVAIVKGNMLARLSSPRVIFVGGSSTLFGIDAIQAEQELGMPGFNFGLHAAMRLDDLLDVPRREARPGDLVVLALEPPIWADDPSWTAWQLRSALAFDSAKLDRLPMLERFRIFTRLTDSQLDYDLLRAEVEKLVYPTPLALREQALLPSTQVLARFEATQNSSRSLDYSMTNLDDRGDMRHTDLDHLYAGAPGDVTAPARIHPAKARLLGLFLNEMKERRASVVFTHTPYLIDGSPAAGWQRAEETFADDLARIGGTLLEKRDELFYPREFFLDTALHLNARGREIRTQRLIDHLRPILPSNSGVR